MYSINELINKWFVLISIGVNPSTRNPTRKYILQSNLDIVPKETGREENKEVDIDVIIVDLIKKRKS